MNDNWIKMIKGEEEKLVHPGNVGNHKRFGWLVFGEPEEIPAEEGSVDYEVPVKMINAEGKEKTVPSGEVKNHELFGWRPYGSSPTENSLSSLTDEELIAKAQAASTFEDLRPFEELEALSPALESVLRAKVEEFYAADAANKTASSTEGQQSNTAPEKSQIVEGGQGDNGNQEPGKVDGQPSKVDQGAAQNTESSTTQTTESDRSVG
jgi:hypothetical protein